MEQSISMAMNTIYFAAPFKFQQIYYLRLFKPLIVMLKNTIEINPGTISTNTI